MQKRAPKKAYITWCVFFQALQDSEFIKYNFWPLIVLFLQTHTVKMPGFEAFKWCRKRTLHCIILKDRTIQLREEKKGKKTVIMGDVTLMTDIIWGPWHSDFRGVILWSWGITLTASGQYHMESDTGSVLEALTGTDGRMRLMRLKNLRGTN